MGTGIFFALIAVKLDVGSLSSPGPGFVPLMMALLLVLLSLWALIKGLVDRQESAKRIYWRRHALVVISVFVYGLLLGFVGFLVSTFLLTCILFGLLAKRGQTWSWILFYAAITAFSAWLIFSWGLGVPFPSLRLWGVRM